MGHSQHRGHGDDDDHDDCGHCGPQAKKSTPSPPTPPPGPTPLPQPCAVSVSDAFIRALLALIATPQQLATFVAFVAPTATLQFGANPIVTGPAAIQAELTISPFVATAVAVNVLSTAFSPTGVGVLATAQANLLYTLPGGAVVTIPATFRIQFDAQCRIVSIVVVGDFSPLAP